MLFNKSKNTQQPAVASTNSPSNTSTSNTSTSNTSNNIAAQSAAIGISSGSTYVGSSAGIYGYGSGSGVGVIGSGGNLGGITAGSLNIGGMYGQQNSSYQWSSSSPSMNFGNNKYSILKLPHELLPEAVYVSGRMITLGAFGSDAECVFVGDALIFAPQVLTAITFNNKITIILQYANKMFHYSISHAYGIIAYKENSVILDATLLSEVQRGQEV